MFTVAEVLHKNYPKFNDRNWLFKPFYYVLKNILHEKECVEFGQLYPHLEGVEFVEQVLEYFNFSYSVRDVEKERIPTQGRVVIISNHPIGSLDGLALLKLMTSIRKDVKVVANQMLMQVEALHSLLLPVNNMGGATVKENIHNIRKFLESEGAVLIFPAGEVSRLSPAGVRDTKWQSGFLRIAKSTKSPILPIHIDGKNSPLFYGLSMIYKPLATMLLVKEMFKQRSKHLPVRIGEIIPYEAFSSLKINKEQQTKLFKKHLYRLNTKKSLVFSTQTSIAHPENKQEVSDALKKSCETLGVTTDNKIIYLYKYTQSSVILREIGRLREMSFRAVGEGSNKRRDTDRYDHEYYHLILWDDAACEIVGAYRFGDAKKQMKLGATTENIDAGEKYGLYTETLFNYTDAMQPYFHQGLELGRSFVQPKYWGKRSLDYLWQGIGAFVQKHPHYRYLFGPVSISDNYTSSAKDLLVRFYQLYFSKQATLAVANFEYIPSPETQGIFTGTNYKEDFILLKHLLANMGLNVPTLYKQYSEICESDGVSFLSFGVDPDFSDCVDGLVLVDLEKLKPKKRQRYLPNMVAAK